MKNNKIIASAHAIVMAIKLMAVKSKFETYRAVNEGYVKSSPMNFLGEPFIINIFILWSVKAT